MNRPRFVFSDEEQDKWLDGPFALINDMEFYFDNNVEIEAWCDSSITEWCIEGKVIRFKDRDDLLLFRLTWNA